MVWWLFWFICLLWSKAKQHHTKPISGGQEKKDTHKGFRSSDLDDIMNKHINRNSYCYDQCQSIQHKKNSDQLHCHWFASALCTRAWALSASNHWPQMEVTVMHQLVTKTWDQTQSDRVTYTDSECSNDRITQPDISFSNRSWSQTLDGRIHAYDVICIHLMCSGGPTGLA